MALTDLLRRLWPPRRRATASIGTAQFVGAWAQTETPQATDATYPTGYTSNGWVYACVDTIADAVSSAPLRVQVQRGEEWEDAPEHPLQALLDHVNADQSQADLLFATSAWLNLHGNAYWRLLFGDRDSNKRKPLAIQVLRPDRTTVKGGRGIRSGKVAGYDYDTGTTATAQQYTEHYSDIEVVHFKRFAPTDDYYGQSPLYAITQIINAYNAAMRFNAAFFSGGGIPSSIITTEGHADDTLLEQIRAMWDQWVARSSDKRRPLILSGGMTLQTPGVAPDQVGTETLPRMLREEICAAMGVPPALVGLYEYANYANVNGQQRIFYNGTVTAEWKRLCSTITEFFTPVYPEKVFRVVADTSAITAMQPDWLDAANAAAVLVRSRIIIPDEAREKLLGMPPLENGLGRVLWGNATDVPIATADDGLLDLLTAAPEPPSVAPTEPVDLPAGSTDAQEQAEKSIVPRVIRLTSESPRSKHNLTEAQKVAHWKATDRRRIGEERFLTRVMDRWYADITREVLANIGASAKALVPERVKDPAVEDLLFDIDGATTHLQGAMGDALSDVIGREWQHALGTVGSEIDFDISDPRAQALIRDRTLQMKTVAETAQSTVRNAIAEGLAEGETVDDLRRRVQGWSKGIAKRHAENVARTEAGVCMNTSARNGYQDGGADGTEWLAARDERSRDWHAAMDGQTRTWDEKFTLNSPDGAIECDGPGDAVLGPGDVCQCRCANAPWFADEAASDAKPPKKPVDDEPVAVGTI